MKIVIEVTEDISDEQLVRMLRDAQRRQEHDAGDGRKHHWIDLETPFMCLHVERIVGVVTAEDSPGDQTIMAVIPLEPQ